MAINLGTGSLGPGGIASFVLAFPIDATLPDVPLRTFCVIPQNPAPNIDPFTPKPVDGFVLEGPSSVSFPIFTTLGVSTVWMQRTEVGLGFPEINYFIMVMNFSDDPIDFTFFVNSTTL